MAEELKTNKEVITSLQIAEITGRLHKNVLKAIREMEPSWEKIAGLKFKLCYYLDENKRERPCYELTKTECLFIATKFKDDTRAKLVLRWEELEKEKAQQTASVIPLTPLQALAQSVQQMVELEQRQMETEKRTTAIEQRLDLLDEERERNTRLLLDAPLSEEDAPALTERAKVVMLVNQYCSANNVKQQDMWREVYKQLYYRCHVRLDAEKENAKQSKLDVAEKRGFMHHIYNIVSNIVGGKSK